MTAADAVSGAVDTDTHVAPASLDALMPYLAPFWRDYAEGAALRLDPAQAGAYPPGATEGPAPADVATLRERVLDVPAPGGVPVRTAVLSATSAFDVSRNPYYDAALCGALNDWVVEHFLDRDDRLRGGVAVPSGDPEAAVAEIHRRAGDPRFVQVLLPVRGHDHRYGHRRFLPVLEAAAETGLAVTLHAWGRAGSAATPTGFTHTYLADYLSQGHLAQAQLTSLVVEGVLDRLPTLRVVVAECGFSWLPPLLWRLDKEWKGIWREVPWVRRPPSTYLHEQVRFTATPAHLPTDPAELADALAVIGAARLVMYAGDHPHVHGDGTARLLAALGPAERAAVLGGTAEEFLLRRGPAPGSSTPRSHRREEAPR
ncbi:amidohydrolase family protein [Actinomycetospora lemnae]|uniref:Amidohydrolase family protein n=1 Tax=Actinomycetospora lemnae TaxID=3019891 RepID=A0ABT5SNX4_9PSEU|nr:amidohydrolase family protein [Actinomycetospora sp. DW7H6]MDD7964545.1 amidohydrolase family protein [Actinomycetospora sp. DW7H6]